MSDPFEGFANISSQGESWAAITPSDSTPLTVVPKALYIGGAGNIALRGADGNDETFPVAAGQMLTLRPVMVLDTGTDATGIIAIY
jgi:hypothetical protein